MARRQSINFPGFRHQNPIPNASKIGNLVMSSVIVGMNPGSRELPPDLAGQMANVFIHMRSAVEAAGGSVDDIIKVNVWLKDPRTQREAVNKEWVKMFPDEAACPARHTLFLAAESPNLVSCDFVAVLQ